jgi:hypothetical protein
LYAQGVLTALALWLGFTMARRKRVTLEVCSFTLAFLLLFSGIQMYYIPATDTFKSVRLAAEKVNTLMPTGGAVAFFHGRYNEGWNFYLKRLVIPVVNAQELQKKDFDVVIVKKRYLEESEKLSSYTAAAHIRVGGDIFYLLVPVNKNQQKSSGLPPTGVPGKPVEQSVGT